MACSLLSVVAGSRGLLTSDPHVRQILDARMPDAPNLGDLRAIDWAAVEPVNVVVAGFPCQDNVAALRWKIGGPHRVLGDLAEAGV